VAPARPNASAVARPMPAPPPVIEHGLALEIHLFQPSRVAPAPHENASSQTVRTRLPASLPAMEQYQHRPDQLGGRQVLTNEVGSRARGQTSRGSWREEHRRQPSRGFRCWRYRPCRGVRDPPPRARTVSTAASTAAAAAGSPRCSSIIEAHQIWPMGLAMPRPAMSGADP